MMIDFQSMVGDLGRADEGHVLGLDRRWMMVWVERVMAWPRRVLDRLPCPAGGKSLSRTLVERPRHQRVDYGRASDKSEGAPDAAMAGRAAGGKDQGSEVHGVARYPVPDEGRVGWRGEQACPGKHFARAKDTQGCASGAMIVTERAGYAAGGSHFRHAQGNREYTKAKADTPGIHSRPPMLYLLALTALARLRSRAAAAPIAAAPKRYERTVAGFATATFAVLRQDEGWVIGV
jgi:hypothetical protein